LKLKVMSLVSGSTAKWRVRTPPRSSILGPRFSTKLLTFGGALSSAPRTASRRSLVTGGPGRKLPVPVILTDEKDISLPVNIETQAAAPRHGAVRVKPSGGQSLPPAKGQYDNRLHSASSREVYPIMRHSATIVLHPA